MEYIDILHFLIYIYNYPNVAFTMGCITLICILVAIHYIYSFINISDVITAIIMFSLMAFMYY